MHFQEEMVQFFLKNKALWNKSVKYLMNGRKKTFFLTYVVSEKPLHWHMKLLGNKSIDTYDERIFFLTYISVEEHWCWRIKQIRSYFMKYRMISWHLIIKIVFQLNVVSLIFPSWSYELFCNINIIILVLWCNSWSIKRWHLNLQSPEG